MLTLVDSESATCDALTGEAVKTEGSCIPRCKRRRGETATVRALRGVTLADSQLNHWPGPVNADDSISSGPDHPVTRPQYVALFAFLCLSTSMQKYVQVPQRACKSR
jgi:hypothetical protein